MFRKAVAIFLMFFLLWGNTGFCLNIHYCHTSDAVSVMVNRAVGERCAGTDMHREANVAAGHEDGARPCCQKMAQTLPSAKKDCCTDTELELKITDAFQGSFSQLDIQKQWHKAIYVPLTGCFCAYAPIPVAPLVNVSARPDAPPGIAASGRMLLLLHGVCRI